METDKLLTCDGVGKSAKQNLLDNALNEAREQGRLEVLSYFVCSVGGYNGSWGSSVGRFREWYETEYGKDWEKTVRHLMNDHERSVTYNLKAEVAVLKVKLYDLQTKS